MKPVAILLAFAATASADPPTKRRETCDELVKRASDLWSSGMQRQAVDALDAAPACHDERTHKIAAYYWCDLAWRERHTSNTFAKTRFMRHYNALSPLAQRNILQCFDRCGGYGAERDER